MWVNQYHSYPARAAFGGYKQSDIGRENHLMVLDHYQETKNLLESYSESPTGLSHSSRCVARCRRGVGVATRVPLTCGNKKVE